jgi:hypothetical protein
LRTGANRAKRSRARPELRAFQVTKTPVPLSKRRTLGPRWSRGTTVAVAILSMASLIGMTTAVAPSGSASVVLAIYPSQHVTVHDNFTVSMEVADTTGIQFVYFTFCQLSSAQCYAPVVMSLHAGNWYVGTTKPMTSYPGMTVGVKAGYNITIVYSNNQNVTEPAIPNKFSNLTIAPSVVAGYYYFEMTVSNPVYRLSGVVSDAVTHALIAGATVTLTPGNNTATTTTSTGSYTFAGLQNGTYTISVSSQAYPATTLSVTIAGHDTVKNLTLGNPSVSPPPRGGLASLFTGSDLLVTVPVILGVVALLAFLALRRRRALPPPSPAKTREPPESSSEKSS